ncbi:acyltransferase [Chitinophaga sp. HK235]|uniref:acyltransferase family protein n=1 Tax=Chitinophaga sp. HK235 TaxID=2952571 RepID=UPI001BAA5EBC|nr:acyltransferase [Chitinophaga sp. HK235]
MILILPFFVLILLMLSTVSLPLFRKLDELQGGRISTLDGLRGYLAFAVVANHLDSNFSVVTRDKWDTLVIFNGMLGEVGVALFFMITGFLFWGKLLKAEGRTDWRALYVGRIFRIAPVYYLVILGAIVIMGVQTGFQLQDKPGHFLFTFFKWMWLGFAGPIDLNGFYMVPLLGVVWTLRGEWILYFSLIFTSFFIRKKIPLLFTAAGFLVSLVHLQIYHPPVATWALFFAGMLCATLTRKKYVPVLDNNLGSAIALACIVSVFVCFNSAVGPVAVFLMFISFLLISNGSDLFGMLSFKGAHRLGNISYSVYLIHMPILYIYSHTQIVKTITQQNALNYWLFLIPVVLIILVISSFCYYFLEKGGIRLGKEFIKKYISKKGTPDPEIIPVLQGSVK